MSDVNEPVLRFRSVKEILAILRFWPATYGAALLVLTAFAIQWSGHYFDGDMARIGALNKPLMIYAGEWWRLTTAPLLHANWGHLTVNVLVLIFCGNYVEGIVGSRRTGGILVLSALMGSLGSLVGLSDHLFSPDEHDMAFWAHMEGPIFSIGASGTFMGLATVSSLISFFDGNPDGNPRAKGGWGAAVTIGLVPIHHGIDYFAHWGGFIGGVIAAFLLWFDDYKDARSWIGPVLGLMAVVGYLSMLGYGCFRIFSSL